MISLTRCYDQLDASEKAGWTVFHLHTVQLAQSSHAPGSQTTLSYHTRLHWPLLVLYSIFRKLSTYLYFDSYKKRQPLLIHQYLGQNLPSRTFNITHPLILRYITIQGCGEPAAYSRNRRGSQDGASLSQVQSLA